MSKTDITNSIIHLIVSHSELQDAISIYNLWTMKYGLKIQDKTSAVWILDFIRMSLQNDISLLKTISQ